MTFHELLQSAAGGDEQALESLYRMYQPLIVRMSMLNNEFDEDLHQEQMICFWKCVKKFSQKLSESCHEKEDSRSL